MACQPVYQICYTRSMKLTHVGSAMKVYQSLYFVDSPHTMFSLGLFALCLLEIYKSNE